MVLGLDLFREHFREYTDCYILIGGAACEIAMEEAAVDFRLTKDLDIVLCAETLNSDFVEAFWAFIRNGKYQVKEKATGKRQCYRFQKSQVQGYPFMLELFSREPDSLSVAPGSHLTPIPTDEDVSSLSAILLSDDYYGFLHAGRRVVDGLSFIRPEHMVPLKAGAWLDLSERRAQGKTIDSRSIKKHKNDIFRLSRILDPDFKAEMPVEVRNDLREFVARVEAEGVDLKSLRLGDTDLGSILALLRRIYELD